MYYAYNKLTLPKKGPDVYFTDEDMEEVEIVEAYTDQDGDPILPVADDDYHEWWPVYIGAISTEFTNLRDEEHAREALKDALNESIFERLNDI